MRMLNGFGSGLGIHFGKQGALLSMPSEIEKYAEHPMPAICTERLHNARVCL